MQNQEQTIKPLTSELTRINNHLNMLNFKRKLTHQDITTILKTEPESRFRSALNNAVSNPQALTYLQDIFDHMLPEQANTYNQNQSTEIQSIDSNSEYLSHHVYGRKGALCLNASITKSGFPTVSIDAATATGPKQYNWGQKITLQLTQQELPIFLAILMGFIPQIEFNNHNKKSMKIKHQGNSLYFQLFGAGLGSRSVPCHVSDCFYLASLTVKQLKLAQPWLESTDIALFMRQIVGHMQNQTG